MNDRVQPEWRVLYERVAPILVVLCLLCAIFASVGTYWQSRVNAQQDHQRTQDNTALLGCFDQFASASSFSSAAVRAATIRKDEATTVRDNALNVEGRALQVVVEHLLTQSVTRHDVKTLADALEVRSDASEKLDKAQDALDRVRRDNPVPKPPSQFCSVKQ